MKSAEALGGGINKTEAKYLKNERTNRNSERKRAFGACLPALHEGWRRPIWLDFLPMRQLHTSLIFYFPSHSNASRQPEILTLQHLPRSCLSGGFLSFDSECTLWTLLSLLTWMCFSTHLPSPWGLKEKGFALSCSCASWPNSVPGFADRMRFGGLSEMFIHLHFDKFPSVSHGWT